MSKPNRTVHRHTVLTAVFAGEVNILVEAFALPPSIQRALDMFRANGFVTSSGQSPATLTESGLELLNEWDATYGSVNE